LDLWAGQKEQALEQEHCLYLSLPRKYALIPENQIFLLEYEHPNVVAKDLDHVVMNSLEFEEINNRLSRLIWCM